MDEHPQEWWEVASDASAWRVNDAVAEAWKHALEHGIGPNGERAITFTDIYGAAATVVIGSIVYLYHITIGTREGTRLRDTLGKREDEAFAKEHELPEWERT